MSALQVVKYVIAFAICYFSFVVLQRHYTEKMTWVDAMKEGGKHIGIGLVLTIGIRDILPIGQRFLKDVKISLSA